MKLAIAYLFLIGIPIFCVIGILRLGENLTAPVAVKGVWLVDKQLEDSNTTSCGEYLNMLGWKEMTISQSGPDLVISFNDISHTTLLGTIDALEISAQGKNPNTPIQLEFHAEFDRQSDPNRLSMVIQTSRCPDPLKLTAYKLQESVDSGVEP
jgi:hypothetical protein